MINTLYKTFIITLLSFTIGVSLYAQEGVVSGNVVDEYEGSGLPGANVYLEADKFKGAITDLNGNFTLTNISLGQQVVVVSFLGFETLKITLDVQEGENSLGEIMMRIKVILGDEIVITSQALGQQKAIGQQLNMDAIANIVSADKIQELPDVNAAEAIARLPGVAINRSGGEGQKIVIRGMQPKFAAITINGVRLPSNSPNDRSVDLSLISPELLDGIEVYKSPLPYMDAEATAGTVNLKLRKAPNEMRILAKMLGGYNMLNDDFGDYKGVLQFSNRLFDNKLGFVVQSSYERFNRGGDLIRYRFRQGSTDAETGVTEIEGSSLNFVDTEEKRKRWNSSLSLDYDLSKGHSLSLFGFYSRTDRNKFLLTNEYNPERNEIGGSGQGIENRLDLYSLSLNGVHPIGNVLLDWTLSSSQSESSTPYDFTMNFIAASIGGLFDPELDRTGHPSTYLDAAIFDPEEVFLVENDLSSTNTLEKVNTAIINLKIPIKLNDDIGGYLKFGGKFSGTDRERNVDTQSERFYYLGGAATSNAAALYGEGLEYISSNNQLISIDNFIATKNNTSFTLEDGSPYIFQTTFDQDKVRSWSNTQRSIFTNDRYALVDNYDVSERIYAGYAMLKLKFGDKLTVIPGFRYEYSDNEYNGPVLTADGVYGEIGSVNDTTTYQTYGELFPHLHVKYKPFEWFDVRFSYAKTLARPDYNYIAPRAEINSSSTSIQGGNPNLSYALSTSYDLNLSFFKPGLGLFAIGGFYKDIDNVFIQRSTVLATPELAEQSGWPGYSGYTLDSYANLGQSKVWGFEAELQTNLARLPKPFDGIVLSINYARLFSETQVFFLTSETTFGGGFPPIPKTTYIENQRTVNMPNQAPHIFRASIGYDFKGFSTRISASFQGTKARSYSLNKDFDSFDLKFWRWDASAKQRFGDHWSVFLNLNNISDQQDITFTRNESYLTRIDTYGFTSTIGVQFKI